jgi:Ca2+-binding EF-hand superfamily protein
MDKRVKLTELFKRYDSNDSGKLEREQINAILTDIDFSTPPGTPPTEDELDFIVKVGDRSGDGCIERKEFENALVAWRTYTKQREQLEALIKKYDKSGTGKLEKDELKMYLTDCNNGQAPNDAEVEWVMSEADFMGDGAIRQQEIMMATQSWYAFQNQKAEQEEAAKGSCCSIS